MLSNTCDTRCFFCSWVPEFFFDSSLVTKLIDSTVSSWPIRWARLMACASTADLTKGQPSLYFNLLGFRLTPPALREIRSASLSLVKGFWSCLVFPLLGLNLPILKMSCLSLAVLFTPFHIPLKLWKTRHGVRRLPPVPAVRDYPACHCPW